MNDLALLPGTARSPARPGPGPVPQAAVRRLQLLVGRIDGLAAGDDRAYGLGLGSELAQIRDYIAGDDVRRIDPNATARTGGPQVRLDVPERARTTWLLIDRSASMTFGTALRRKADVAEGAALVVMRLASQRADRLGVVTFADQLMDVAPPKHGRAGLLAALHIMATPDLDVDRAATTPGPALSVAARANRGALVILISDFRGRRDWEPAMLEARGRHQVVAIEVRDPREGLLADVGMVELHDPETDRRVVVDTSDHILRGRFREAAARERAALAAEFARLGVRHVTLSTDRPWLTDLASQLSRRRILT
jgi:uncharacterized protein (DUF58 family)